MAQLLMVVHLSLAMAEQMEPVVKTLGENLIVIFEGDTSRGCRVTQRLPGSEKNFCCFSAEVRGETLCAPGYDHSCREYLEFNVEENLGKCILTLLTFKCSDEGTYMVKFPGKLSDHKEIKVSTSEKSCQTSIVLVIACSVIFTIMVTLVAVSGIYLIVKQKKKVVELCCCHVEAQSPETNSLQLQTAISEHAFKQTVPKNKEELNKVLKFITQCESQEVLLKLKKTDFNEEELGKCLKAAKGRKADCYRLINAPVHEVAKTRQHREQKQLNEDRIQTLDVIIQVLEQKIIVKKPLKKSTLTVD